MKNEMSDSILTVIAKIKAKPGMEEEVLQGLTNIIAPSRQERGNLNYDIYQSNSDPTLFFTYEKWTGQEALDNHMQTPHFKKLDAQSKETLAQPMEVNLLTHLKQTADSSRKK